MEDFIESIHEELIKYDNYLQNDLNEFNEKLNLTRKNLFNYIDRQIELLKKIKEEYKREFNYLDEENKNYESFY
ncbi:unnamed protein product [Rotaria sordida]|uniref:Uncharacterized protein n=1 Tax=Rotaria sordida TaxID=392033 RepID=A0A815RTG4_9BILA|nr:unnamed protein product [Rotaria sordida]